jgi:hypothetical protein
MGSPNVFSYQRAAGETWVREVRKRDDKEFLAMNEMNV